MVNDILGVIGDAIEESVTWEIDSVTRTVEAYVNIEVTSSEA